jgi:hypothetical protein
VSVFRILILAAALCTSAAAQPIQLSGTVGNLPVFVDLSRNGDTVSGWYYYLKVGKQLRLAGKLDPNGFFQIEEYTANTNTRTGSFTGRIREGRWTGNWHNAKGRAPHDIALTEVRGTPPNGRFKCSTKRRDREFGDTYTHSIDLVLSKGRVKRLSLSRDVRSDQGEEQSCRIGLGDLKQLRSRAGILLRAKGDDTDGEQHCTIRILPAGNYLVVKTGDASQAGDDCRGASDTMFCGPRGFWADLIVNRKTQSCRQVQ